VVPIAAFWCSISQTLKYLLNAPFSQDKSFDSLESWKEEFLMQGAVKDQDGFPFIVLGNKSDLETQRKVS